MWPHLCSARPAWNTEGISLQLKRNFSMLVDFESCIRVGCTAFWFRSISTDILFLFFFFWTFLFLQGSVEDWLGPFYSRLGPVEDRCLHLGGCMCQWERLDWSLSSCLVVRKTGWVFQDCGVWFSLPMELVCVSSEIPRTRDTAPFPSSSVGISSLCVRIDPWVLVIGGCRHDFIVFHSWASFRSLHIPHRVYASICWWILWWPANLGDCK